MKLSINKLLAEQLDEIAEVAGYLWQRGWAERNAGNISVCITSIVGEENKALPAIATYPLRGNYDAIGNEFFYVTGTGKRMRDVAKSPLDHGAIVHIASDGASYDILSEKDIKPTSELDSHLSILASFRQQGSPNRLVLHTHPTDLIALSHIPEFKDEAALNNLLWSMHPETFIVVPRGIGMVPYEVPGTQEIAALTLPVLASHDVVIWEKHGVIAVGQNLSDTFDLIDTLSKSAQIYAFARMCGHEPEGLSSAQIKDLIIPFGIDI